MSAAGTGELQFIEGTMNANMYCNILKQSVVPSFQKLSHMAVFQHENDPKHTIKTTTALLEMLRVKVMDWPSIRAVNEYSKFECIFEYKKQNKRRFNCEN